MSLGETLIKPTAMLYRNLASMDVEESIRANPMDGVVLLCGCDKTTPSLVMGACSVNIPTIVVSGGPMLTGKYNGRDIGTSDVWRFTDDVKSGIMSEEELNIAEAGLCRSQGHCAVMGTASTMATMVESLGLTLPQNAAIPAADSRRKVLAQLSGKRIVEMVREDQKLSDILTREAFENAIKVNAAIGGSTNFVIHLLAIAGRIGVPLEIKDFDRFLPQFRFWQTCNLPESTSWKIFIMPAGVPAILKELDSYLNTGCITANGKTIRENYQNAKCYNREVIASIDKPFNNTTALAVLYGNICENGAVIKPTAASPHLFQHSGKAIVFENIEDYKSRIDDPDLPVDENSVLVLKNVGPKGYPGMPEVGNMTLPLKLLEKGIKDIVRISDGRMSGTGFGTVVLHISPEATLGGNFSVLETGDLIILDLHARTLNVDLSAEELQRRKDNWKPSPALTDRGYTSLYINNVEQAHLGADLGIPERRLRQ
jgi:L-arabonate dehydrase